MSLILPSNFFDMRLGHQQHASRCWDINHDTYQYDVKCPITTSNTIIYYIEAASVVFFSLYINSLCLWFRPVTVPPCSSCKSLEYDRQHLLYEVKCTCTLSHTSLCWIDNFENRHNGYSGLLEFIPKLLWLHLCTTNLHHTCTLKSLTLYVLFCVLSFVLSCFVFTMAWFIPPFST